jgi:hypothetical protein
MDTNYYAEETIDGFLFKKLCQKDFRLKKALDENDGPGFRKRIANIANRYTDGNVEQVIYATVTDAFRDVILNGVGSLAVDMDKWGVLIVSGGEAFNTYFKKGSRIITSDIDTKFVPFFTTKDGPIGPENAKFFGYLQAAKLQMWHFLGKMAKSMSKRDFTARIRAIEKSPVGRMLGLKFPKVDNLFTRRYVLKYKDKRGGKTPMPKDVLIDVEIMSIDMKINAFIPSKNARGRMSLAILDVAYMRPGEFGYKASIFRTKGMTYRNFLTGKMTTNRNISVTGKRYLVEDLYIMTTLGLRPTKYKKDHTRMVRFARDVLNVGVTKYNSDLNIFLKVGGEKIKDPPRPPAKVVITDKDFMAAIKDPAVYERWTTTPQVSRVQRLHAGLKVPSNLDIEHFELTDSKWRFDTWNQKWVKNDRTRYIKDEAVFRLKKNASPPSNKRHLDTRLYGMSTPRNSWAPALLYKYASDIPSIGLRR